MKKRIILFAVVTMLIMTNNVLNVFANNAPIPWSTEFRDTPFSYRTDRDGQEHWIYYKQDGFIATNQWVQNHKYNWFYCNEDGYLIKNTWLHDTNDGKYYYLGDDYAMLHDTTTPDGYQVGSDGAWIKDCQVVIEKVEESANVEATK